MRAPLPLVLRPSRVLLSRSAASPRHPLIRPAIAVSRYSSSQAFNPVEMSGLTATNPDHEGPKPLAEFTPEEYRKYNRIAFGMEGMHSELRDMFLSLQASIGRMSDPVARPQMENFIKRALTFCEELENHHNREEAFLFPKLAIRMPEFGPESVLVDQHARVHVGASAWEKYLHECQVGVKKFEVEKVREMMGTFADTLMDHLDLEVFELRADKIQAKWTLEEFRKIP